MSNSKKAHLSTETLTELLGEISEAKDSVLQTIGDVVAVVEKPKRKSTKKKLENKPAFTLIEKEDNVWIAIQNEQLRRFIWDQMDDQTIVNHHFVYQPEDNETVKQAKDRAAVFPIEKAVQQWVEWFDENGKNLFDNLYERHENIADIVTSFGEVITTQRDKLVEESKDALNGGAVSFNRLFFALGQPNLTICVSRQGSLIAGEVTRVQLEPESFFRPAFIRVNMKIYTHNGSSITATTFSHAIFEYEGEANVTDLGLVTLTDTIKEELINRGKKYVRFTERPSYLSYSGYVTRRSYWADNTFRANGRVMIDFTAMKSIDSNYSMYFSMDRDRDRERNDTGSKFELSDLIYMSTSPYVYGFSFSAKVWGEMLVEDLTEVVFREDAYDMLVLPQEIKDMLAALVDSNNLTGKDFIDGKGGGCIFLLAGSPGVGKTLTAEAIAEMLQKPLYMVGIGELGTNVGELESNLRDILDIAASWNAVLLLDEADIFMEKRDDANIERNAMVGVFLRMLEYYQGTLFLTTNRAKSIDEAFYSRISLAIKYDDLNTTSREIIWTNILKLYGLEHIDVQRLSHHDINGRQIKNVTRIVTALAQKGNYEPTTEHFIGVIDHVTKFNISK